MLLNTMFKHWMKQCHFNAYAIYSLYAIQIVNNANNFLSNKIFKTIGTRDSLRHKVIEPNHNIEVNIFFRALINIVRQTVTRRNCGF
jgi:hypothetical protein